MMSTIELLNEIDSMLEKVEQIKNSIHEKVFESFVDLQETTNDGMRQLQMRHLEREFE